MPNVPLMLTLMLTCNLFHAPERPGGGTGASGKAEICVLACGQFADVLLISAKSQKSRQSQESVQVGPLHSRRTGARGAGWKAAESGRKSVGKRPETAGETLQMGLRSGQLCKEMRFCRARSRVEKERVVETFCFPCHRPSTPKGSQPSTPEGSQPLAGGRAPLDRRTQRRHALGIPEGSQRGLARCDPSGVDGRWGRAIPGVELRPTPG